ncbi:MAG: hydrogenase [Chloroflexi bacterium]|nr:hydrogenase [Chloroflexota bacterium]
MENLIDFLLVLALLLGFACLGLRRVSQCVWAAAAQGIITGILLLIVHDKVEIGLIIVVASSIVVKGLVVPWYLTRTIRTGRVEVEVEPFIGFNLSLVVGGLAFGAALWLSTSLTLPFEIDSELIIPISLATAFIGLLTIISRRKAITQVAAFLVLENGIFMFGLVLVSALPTLVEMGVLLDLFAAVFVMGVTIHNINREFDHIDTSRLNQLHDMLPARRWRMPRNGVRRSDGGGSDRANL